MSGYAQVLLSDLDALVEIVLVDRTLASWWQRNSGHPLGNHQLEELRRLSDRRRTAWERVSDAVLERTTSAIGMAR